MNPSQRRQANWQLSSWVQALIVAFVSPIVLIVLGELLGRPGGGFSPGETFSFAVYAVGIVAACFVICHRHPRSAWYVPFICNTAGIVAACIEPNFWRTPMWMSFVAVWVFAVAGAIFGARNGRRPGPAPASSHENPRR